MGTYAIHIKFTGKIHDHDFGFWNSDEEEPYNFSLVRHLNTDSMESSLELSHTVDNEVKLLIKLKLSMSAKKIVTVSGDLELWEGPYKWTKDVAVKIPKTTLKAGTSGVVYKGTLANNGGDWATVTGTITVAPKPQEIETNQPGSPKTKTRITVIAETPNGRNVRFWDNQLNIELTRRGFVQQIHAGVYKDYHVAMVNGIETPKSKANKTKGDNLG